MIFVDVLRCMHAHGTSYPIVYQAASERVTACCCLAAALYISPLPCAAISYVAHGPLYILTGL